MISILPVCLGWFSKWLTASPIKQGSCSDSMYMCGHPISIHLSSQPISQARPTSRIRKNAYFPPNPQFSLKNYLRLIERTCDDVWRDMLCGWTEGAMSWTWIIRVRQQSHCVNTICWKANPSIYMRYTIVTFFRACICVLKEK